MLQVTPRHGSGSVIGLAGGGRSGDVSHRGGPPANNSLPDMAASNTFHQQIPSVQLQGGQQADPSVPWNRLQKEMEVSVLHDFRLYAARFFFEADADRERQVRS